MYQSLFVVFIVVVIVVVDDVVVVDVGEVNIVTNDVIFFFPVNFFLFVARQKEYIKCLGTTELSMGIWRGFHPFCVFQIFWFLKFLRGLVVGRVVEGRISQVGLSRRLRASTLGDVRF